MKARIEPVRVDFKIPIAPGVAVDRSVFCYLIMGDGVWIVDAGVRGADGLLLERIRSHGFAPKDVKAIIHTHAHPDHMGSTKRMKELTGCELLIHSAEAEWLEHPRIQHDQRPVPGFFELIEGGVRPDRVLFDQDVVELGRSGSLRVTHVPGHSPGSIALLQELGFLFVGDAVPVPGQIPVYDDAVLAFRSIHKLKKLRGISTICSAWEAPSLRAEASEALRSGLRVVEEIHELVKAILMEKESPPEELCLRCVSELGLPPEMANPLIARTFEAHRRALKEGYERLA